MRLDHWMVALDLTDMDVFLLGYVNFLTEKAHPEKITFVHIMESIPAGREIRELFPEQKVSTEQIQELIKEEIRDNVDDFLLADVNWTVDVVAGEVTETMIRTIKKVDPDLLIMGKKTGYEGEGVISRKVVKYVPCSVMFIPETARYYLQKLLIPINFNEHSANALRFGYEFSKSCEASITALHVYQYPPQFFPGIPIDEFRETMQKPLKEKLRTFRKTFDLPDDVSYQFVLNKSKKVPDKIYDQSIREQADMILVGARNRTTLSNVLMDDLADRMIQYAYGVPLMIIKDKKRYKGLIESFLKE